MKEEFILTTISKLRYFWDTFLCHICFNVRFTPLKYSTHLLRLVRRIQRLWLLLVNNIYLSFCRFFSHYYFHILMKRTFRRFFSAGRCIVVIFKVWLAVRFVIVIGKMTVAGYLCVSAFVHKSKRATLESISNEKHMTAISAVFHWWDLKWANVTNFRFNRFALASWMYLDLYGVDCTFYPSFLRAKRKFSKTGRGRLDFGVWKDLLNS